MGIVIWENTPTFEEWCKILGFDVNDDEVYNSYCEWKANSAEDD